MNSWTFKSFVGVPDSLSSILNAFLAGPTPISPVSILDSFDESFAKFVGFLKPTLAWQTCIDVLSEGTISDVLEEPEGVPPELPVVHELVGILSTLSVSVLELFAATILVGFPLFGELLYEVRSVDGTVEDAGVVEIPLIFLDEISETVSRPISQLSVVFIGLSILLDNTIVDIVSSLLSFFDLRVDKDCSGS